MEDICFSGVPELKLDDRIISEKPRYVAIISGLMVGEASQNPLPLEMFVDMITGQLGSSEEQEMMAQVVRVIVAGNSLALSEEPKGSGNSTMVGLDSVLNLIHFSDSARPNTKRS